MLKACLAIIRGNGKNKSLKTIGNAPDIDAFRSVLVDVILETMIVIYI